MPTKTARIPEDVSGRQRRTPVGEVSWRTTFRALRHRNYRLFFYGQLVSLIGTWMQTTALSWYIYQLTGSKLLLGAVSAVGSAPIMIFSLWGGTLADLYPKRSILVITQIAQMLCAFVVAAGVWLHLATPAFVLVLSGLNGIALGFDIPARQAFTVEMTSRDDLLNAISLNSSIFNGARVLGPAVAGFLVGAIGVALCLLLNAVSFIAVLVGLLMMRLPAHDPPVLTVSAGRHAWEGVRYALLHPRVRMILLLFFVVGVFGWSYSVLMPAFARDVLHLGPNGYGFLMAANGVGALIGALAVATWGHLVAPRKLALGGVYLFSAALFAFAFTDSFYLALVPLVLGGFGMLLFFSTSNTTVQTIVPDEMRGRVMGVWSLVFGAMIPLGSLQAGALAHWVGTPFTLAFNAVICVVAGIVTRIAIVRREKALARG
ncbi:MAG: MFS transporter [Verrucomicrobiota bacterium]